MTAVRIALVQQHASSDRKENLERGLDAVRSAAEMGAELVCFAELAFEPFYPQEEAPENPLDLAEAIPGPTTESLAAAARELGVVIVPNLFERDGAQTYDASPVIDADGTIVGVTRMVHVPDYEGFHEKGYYTPGNRGLPVYETAAGRIGVAICYDRHFPEAMRSLALGGAQLVLVPQAGVIGEWPEGLFEAEMRVAAFQNGYFVALCNRVGKEPKLEFAGESFVCDPEGNVIARATRATDEILVGDLDLAAVKRSHARRLFLPDRRPELYAAWMTRKVVAGDEPATGDGPSSEATVTLREISQENLRDVMALSRTLPPGQDRMVAPNAVSIAEAHFSDKAWFRAVYADDTPVGFVMLYDNPEEPEYYLWRFMIGRPYQGKGFGRRAIELVIGYVRSRPGATELLTSYVPIEGGPEPFYRKLGFVPTGDVHEGEIVVRLEL
ncbi:MAG: GNAT family N-acetyltransferase [Candidatus Bipolaricaulota bacterium]|nr:MAG: GNAT family N-acetyltransferase [Candidatus Bipolaricaulota bacterium]